MCIRPIEDEIAEIFGKRPFTKEMAVDEIMTRGMHGKTPKYHIPTQQEIVGKLRCSRKFRIIGEVEIKNKYGQYIKVAQFQAVQ